MTSWLILILWTWTPDQAALEVYTCAFAAIYDVSCDEALAVAWVESRHRRNPTSSYREHPWSLAHPWRICGAFQVTGGRYGKPHCALVVGVLWIGVWAGVSHIAYWQGRCRRTWPCAYNRGNDGCRMGDGCDYQRKVAQRARWKPWERM